MTIAATEEAGSSPRGRGTGQRVPADQAPRRVIPAWAGNRDNQEADIRWQTGHPRVGGEQSRQPLWLCRLAGSSPRGRGTGGRLGNLSWRTRVIPAWAGNSILHDRQHDADAGHPRVGGEQGGGVQGGIAGAGSSPRGRGTAFRTDTVCRCWRVIPAWAGNSRYALPPKPHWSGHPRVGGEQAPSRSTARSGGGSSPRGRGTGHGRRPGRLPARVIPAWAGNSCGRNGRRRPITGHPRVGGEQLDMQAVNAMRAGSSPRGRGTGNRLDRRRAEDRVIPAWAGNSGRADRAVDVQPGHPRVGGEQARRKPCVLDRERVIPAWAGNRPPRRRSPPCRTGHPRVGGEQGGSTKPHELFGGSSPRGRGTGG